MIGWKAHFGGPALADPQAGAPDLAHSTITTLHFTWLASSLSQRGDRLKNLSYGLLPSSSLGIFF